MDEEYPNYYRYRPAPVKRGAWRIATGHCLGAIGIVLLAIVAVIALIGVIEISKHRKAWEMMQETVTGLHDVLVNGGGIISEFQEAVLYSPQIIHPYLYENRPFYEEELY